MNLQNIKEKVAAFKDVVTAEIKIMDDLYGQLKGLNEQVQLHMKNRGASLYKFGLITFQAGKSPKVDGNLTQYLLDQAAEEFEGCLNRCIEMQNVRNNSLTRQK